MNSKREKFLRQARRLRPEVPMTVTDRAYTSPIWYTPVLSRVEGPGK